MKPIEFGLDHDSWRRGQYDAVQWGLNFESVGIMEAPTGSGKTGIARAMSNEEKRSIALTRIKVLQMDNYEGAYGFRAVYGKSNYPCEYNRNVNCDECAFAKSMKECPVYSACRYVNARESAKISQLASLNYAYYLLMRKKWPQPELLILDEAHQLPELTLEHAGIEISKKQKEYWELPSFPAIFGGKRSVNGSNANGSEERAVEWLRRCFGKLKSTHLLLQGEAPFNAESRKLANRCEIMMKKVESSIHAIELNPHDWFIRSGANAINGEFGFFAKPLTAKHHFGEYFLGEWRTLLMSATLGDMNSFTDELGIDEYDFYMVPPIFEKERQPIHALDVPRMGYKSTESDKNQQASEIARMIKKCNPSWSGIIHTNSYAHAKDIAFRLGRMGLNDRVFMNQTRGTDNQVNEWDRRRTKTPGSILLSPSFHEGYDGTEERINICAKIPYPFLGSEYEKQRQKYDGKWFFWRAASGAQQMMGRIRRGREEDYDTDDEMRTMNCFADGAWNYVKKYFSPHFRECIVRA